MENKTLTEIKKQSETCKKCEFIKENCNWKHKCIMKIGKGTSATTQVKWCSKRKMGK